MPARSFLVIGAHVVVREGLRRIISAEFEDAVFTEAEDALQALAQLRTANFDLVLLETAEAGGFEILNAIRHLSPHPPVIVFGADPERRFAVRALKAGAAGCLIMDSSREEIVAAARRVLSGGRYIASGVAERIVSEIAAESQSPRHGLLSDREYAIMIAIASGRRLSDIAAALSVSVKTVSTYRRRALRKLGLATNADLTRYAIEHKLI